MVKITKYEKFNDEIHLIIVTEQMNKVTFTMKNAFVAASTALILLLLFASSSPASWLHYEKPAYRGQILDDETRQPLQGVVVKVFYYKQILAILGSGQELLKVRETLTDKNGIFYVPSYSTTIDPFSQSSFARFVFFKPGYGGSYHLGNLASTGMPYVEDIECFFSENFGKEGKIRFYPNPRKRGTCTEWQKVVFGIIRLPRLKTMEERRLVDPMSTLKVGTSSTKK